MNIDIKHMTVEKIESSIIAVVNDITRIKMQLEMAKSDAANGIYSDPVWFRSATFALRKKGAEHQALLKELSKIKAEQRQAQAKRFERLFVDEARRLLPVELFREVKESALHLMSIDLEDQK